MLSNDVVKLVRAERLIKSFCGEVKYKLSEVAGNWVCIGNSVQSKLGGKELFFDSLGAIKLVRYGDFNNGGVVWLHMKMHACWCGDWGKDL